MTGPVDDLDVSELLREAERRVAPANAFTLCISDEQRRELTLIHERLRSNPGGPLQ
jgi:hypothetical protein